MLSSAVEGCVDLTFVGDDLVIMPVRHFLPLGKYLRDDPSTSQCLACGAFHARVLEDGAPIWNFIGAGHRATQFSSDALRIVIGERVSGDGKSQGGAGNDVYLFFAAWKPSTTWFKVARDQANPCSTDDYILFYVELAAGHFDVRRYPGAAAQ